MADYRILKDFILRWEGGYSHHQEDPGGATMRGITLATYARYKRERGGSPPSPDSLREITQKEWTDIFRTYYWDPCCGDRLASQSIANALIDWYWCSGSTAVRHAQRIAGVRVDGVVGRDTLDALNSRGTPLALLLQDARRKFIDDLCRRKPQMNTFRRGWLRRIASLQRELERYP